jgi:hypothetical protein
MRLSRRTLLAGSVAAVAAPATLWLAEGTAQAAASYDVAVCEQYRNQVQIHSSAAGWTSPHWAWSPGGGGWANLSDVKFRTTAKFGEVALVAASGGNVGMLGNLGHSLDASHKDSGILLVSHTSAVVSINKTTHVVSTVHANHAVKSFSQHSSGEAFWVQSTGKTYHGDSRTWVNPDVQFFAATGARSFTRGLSYGAEFYKARLHAVGYH